MMKNYYLAGILFTLIVIFHLSCSKKSSDNPITPSDPPQQFKITDFPNKPGCEWVYSVFDSYSKTIIDTVRIKIDRIITLPNQLEATQCIYVSKNRIDTFRVSSGDSTLLSEPTLIGISSDYYFPFYIGRKWRASKLYNDDISVISIDSVSVHAGNYLDAFHLHESYHEVDTSIDVDLWIVKKIGFVKKRFSTFPFMSDTTWELIDFKIVD